MINRLIDIIRLFFLVIYSGIMYFYNRIVRVSNRSRESWQNQGQRTPDQSTADVNPSTNIRVSNNFQRNDISSERLYNSGAPMASNIGDNSDNLIDNFHPENTVIPKDYLFLLERNQRPNTEFDINNQTSLDGAGVYPHCDWINKGINRPWFETCLSPMECRVVEGTLENNREYLREREIYPSIDLEAYYANQS
jgi:hypothetical protein